MPRLKRVLDVVIGCLGLMLLAPLLAIIAGIVRRDGGPALFRQRRVGQGGREFYMLKFRTMVPDAEARGPKLTVAGDGRVTPAGRWLRRCKLDELPQLMNVVIGDMSLVGPRPEVPGYVARYSDDERRVLNLVPGLTDAASIAFRNEADLLGMAPDPERTYFEEIMPEKIRLNLQYAARASLLSDLGILLRTVAALATDFSANGRRKTSV